MISQKGGNPLILMCWKTDILLFEPKSYTITWIRKTIAYCKIVESAIGFLYFRQVGNPFQQELRQCTALFVTLRPPHSHLFHRHSFGLSSCHCTQTTVPGFGGGLAFSGWYCLPWLVEGQSSQIQHGQSYPVYSWQSVVLFVPNFVLASILSRLSLFATFSEMFCWKYVLKESFGSRQTPRYFGLLSFCMVAPCNCRWRVVHMCTWLSVNILYTVLEVFIFSFQSSQKMEI